MKSILNRLGAVLTLGAALFSFTVAKADTMSYSSNVGAALNFDGAGNFNFTPSTNSFTITLDGTATGLQGDMGGSFSIGSIIGPIFGTSFASISGTGSFAIHDAFSNSLTATLNWVDMSQTGTGGQLNVFGAANLSGISYSGSNLSLLALAAAGTANNAVSFQFSSTTSILSLKTVAQSTSFSGSVNFDSHRVPDGSATLVLLGLGLSGLAFLRRKIAA